MWRLPRLLQRILRDTIGLKIILLKDTNVEAAPEGWRGFFFRDSTVETSLDTNTIEAEEW